MSHNLYCKPHRITLKNDLWVFFLIFLDSTLLLRYIINGKQSFMVNDILTYFIEMTFNS